VDRFTGAPLAYARDRDGYRLYGAGADLDDDGGRWPVRPRTYYSADVGDQSVEEIDEAGARRFLGAERIAAYRAAGRGHQIADGDIVFWPPRVEWDEPGPPAQTFTVPDAPPSDP
jgi:hypothetical protein